MSGHTRLCYATNGGFLYDCHCDEPCEAEQEDATPEARGGSSR